MDDELYEELSEVVEREPIGKRLAWWELMVKKVIGKWGRITIV